MRHLFSRLTRRPGSKATTRALNCERLEARDVPATVLMYPGENLESNLEGDEPNSQDYASDFLVTRDVHGQIIDFNHDGNADAFYLGYELTEGSGQKFLVTSNILSPLLANAGGQFGYTTLSGASIQPQPFAAGTESGCVVDYNGDGFQDIMTLRTGDISNVQLWHYKNNGNGTFSYDSSVTQPLGRFAGTFPASPLAMADFNGDGALDILIPGADSINSYTLFNGTLSSGKWTGKFDLQNSQMLNFDTVNQLNPNVSGGASQTLPVCADLDGDGDLDIVTQAPGGIRVFKNDGSGLFATHNDIPSADGNIGINLLAADFNGDGKVDLASTTGRMIVPTSHGIGQLSIYINTTTGSGGPTFAPAVGYQGSQALSTLAAADMNLDGKLDIVAAVVASSAYWIFEGAGNGTFPNSNTFSGFNKTGAGSGGIGIADWNHDGQADVAMGTRYPNYGDIYSSNFYNATIGVSINGTFPIPGVSPRTLPAATVGQAYSEPLVPTPGDSSLAYTVSVDPSTSTLPPGLSVDASNRVVGVPTRSGPFQVLFRVTQPNGLTGTTLVYLQVNPANQGALTISPATLPNVSLNQVVTEQLSAAGGTGTIRYAVSSGLLPTGLSLSGTGLIGGTVTATGTYSFTVSATDAAGSTGYRQYTVVSTAAPLVPVLQPPTIVAGALSGNRVTVFDASGNPRASFRPFAAAYTGGVNVAQGDVNGDGVPDLISAVAGGAGPIVRVFNGRDLALITSFTAYTPNFTGGVRVSAGDLDGDGRAEVITGAGVGEVSRVKVFSGTTGALQRAFFPFAQQYRGGVTVASGDVDGDGKADIIAGSGTGMRSTVKVFQGTTGALLSTIQPFAAGYTNGVTVGSGDINGDGHADIVVGTVGGTGGVVKVYSGANNALLHTLNPYGTGYKGGINLSVADLTGDGKAEIVTGTTQANIRPVVKAFSGANYAQIDSFFAYSGAVGVSVAAR